MRSAMGSLKHSVTCMNLLREELQQQHKKLRQQRLLEQQQPEKQGEEDHHDKAVHLEMPTPTNSTRTKLHSKSGSMGAASASSSRIPSSLENARNHNSSGRLSMRPRESLGGARRPSQRPSLRPRRYGKAPELLLCLWLVGVVGELSECERALCTCQSVSH
jgi:hypothetical protein